MKRELKDLIESLTPDQQDRLYLNTVRFKEVDDLQTIREEQQQLIAGYKVASELPDHEWEAMLKRNELSIKMEK